MPLIDMVRPIGANLAPRLCRPDRIVAYFGMTLRVREDIRAKVTRHHLRTEANPQVGLLVAKRHADPVDFPTYKLFVVVGALRSAKDRRAGVAVHCLRQRIAEARAPDVEWIAELCQRLTDTAGRRVLLVQDKKNGLQHGDSAHFRAL